MVIYIRPGDRLTYQAISCKVHHCIDFMLNKYLLQSFLIINGSMDKSSTSNGLEVPFNETVHHYHLITSLMQLSDGMAADIAGPAAY